MHPILAGFYPFLLGSPARCAFLSYLCLYICLGSPARSQLSCPAVALTDKCNNIHNSTHFCNSAPRDDREHVVPQLYGLYYQKICLELWVYPKKYFTYKKVLNALKMQLEMGGKKFNFWSNTFCCLCNIAHDLKG